MTANRLLLVVLVLLAAACGPRARVESVSAEEHVTVEDVAVLPVIGVHRIAAVDEGPTAGAGSFVRYVPDDSVAAILPRIDLIVYPAEHGIEREIGVVRAGVMLYDQRHREVTSTRYVEEGPFPLVETSDTAYRAVVYMEIEGRPMRSLVYLHRVGARFLKIRTTYPIRAEWDPLEVIDITANAILRNARSAK